MSYKTILVHLDPRPRCSERLGLACRLAAQFEAHLVGLYAPGAPRIPSYALAEAGPVLRDVVEQRRAEAARQAQKQFRDAAARHGDAGAEWRESAAEPAAAMCQSARYADLVVAAQPEPQDDAEVRAVAHELALAAGRPVLFVPYAGRFATADEIWRDVIADEQRETSRPAGRTCEEE